MIDNDMVERVAIAIADSLRSNKQPAMAYAARAAITAMESGADINIAGQLKAIPYLIKEMKATGSWDEATLNRVLDNIGPIIVRAEARLAALSRPGDAEEVARGIADEFCLTTDDDAYVARMTAAIATALRARDGEVERLSRRHLGLGPRMKDHG